MIDEVQVERIYAGLLRVARRDGVIPDGDQYPYCVGRSGDHGAPRHAQVMLYGKPLCEYHARKAIRESLSENPTEE